MQSRDERIEKIFSAALAEGDPSTRRTLVERACEGDHELRSRVEGLLLAHDSAGGFLDPVSLGLDETIASASPRARGLEKPGDLVGRYRLLERIGEGGFGTVYRAEQTEPVRRDVALKIIKLGMDTEKVIARFQVERQALAVMDHPNIARVLDGGATDTGRPYFVMELVRGVPITRYCDESRMPLVRRLELFMAVCDAVQHAHQKGIIHRDIKPSNVLVTLHNEAPLAKIIDFGVAKATTERLSERTLQTGFTEFIGTPEYMSPDQTGLSGGDVDTRTDIYSLGVLLYELMVGRTPFDAARLRSGTYEDIRRIIREEDPPQPSARAAGLGGELSGVARRRRMEPTPFLRQICGDLDWIILKAMEKDRLRRYQTASELSDDIARHLNHEPVEACPPAVGYRMRKFVRRNRAGVVVASIVAAAMLVGTGLATMGFFHATRARDEMQRQAARSAAMSHFLTSMLASVQPGRTLGREVSVRYLLSEADREIAEGALDDHPEVEAEIRMTLAGTHQALGDYAAAERHIRAAQIAFDRDRGPDDADALRTRSALAEVMAQEGQFAEAESLARATYDTQLALFGSSHPDTLLTGRRLGVALAHRDRLVEAEALLRDVLRAQRSTLGADHRDTLRTVVTLGVVLLDQAQPTAAESLLRQALSAQHQTMGPEHPDTLDTMNHLARALERQSKLAEAEELYRGSWEVTRRILGPDHPQTQFPLNNLLRVLSMQGKDEASRPLVAERLAFLKRAAQQDDADALTLHAAAWELLNCVPAALRDPLSALPLARRAVELNSADDANLLDTLASAYAATGDLPAAIAAQRQAVTRARRGGPYNLAELEKNLSDLMLANGDIVGAVSVAWEGLGQEVASSLTAEVVVGGSQAARGQALLTGGNCAAAEGQFRACLASRRKALPTDHWLIAETQVQLGLALAGQHRLDEAERELLAGVGGLRGDPRVSAERRREALRRLIEFYDAAKRPADAARWRAELTVPYPAGEGN